jgi:DNA-binding NarL/FixJ family response regulator
MTTRPTSLRVLVTDDHPAVRRGLADLLETTGDLVLVGLACCGDEGVRLACELNPDVVLMDLSMPGMDGQTATQRILAARPGTRVVILTAFADRVRVAGALADGAVMTVLKDAPPAELLAAVRAAAGGSRPAGRAEG